jgi:hypothetical protein
MVILAADGPGIVPFTAGFQLGSNVVWVSRDPTGTLGLFAVFKRDARLVISCCRRLIKVPISVSLVEGAGGAGGVGGGVTGAGGGGAGTRANGPPLLPVIIFPFASTLNVILRGPLGVVYTRFPPLSDVNVPVTKDQPDAVEEGVSVHEFPV